MGSPDNLLRGGDQRIGVGSGGFIPALRLHDVDEGAHRVDRHVVVAAHGTAEYVVSTLDVGVNPQSTAW